MFSITVADQDNDGNHGLGPVVTSDQAETLAGLLADIDGASNGKTAKVVLEKYVADSIPMLPRKQFGVIAKRLREILAEKTGGDS